MEEVLPLVFGAALTWLVQFSKKNGVDPKVALAVLSLTAAAIYGAVRQLWGVEYIESVSRWFVTMAGVASLVYNLLKGYAGLEGSDSSKK